MDVTPSPKMFQVMTVLVDSFAGPEPSKLLNGPEANRIREKRRLAYDILHGLVGLSMREGVNRAIVEARKRQAGILEVPQDMEDRNAVARAKDEAVEGKTVSTIGGARPLTKH